ncbi:MAG: 3'(2'),5'-bisphosphate nucleotidase CysQ [Gammaproteobacteria bacterium]|jgi:3'(2'), 5'-bisphosphate nucleotidase
MTPDADTLDRLRNAALHLAHKAGEAIMEVYEQGFEVTRKDDNTPLTTADLAAHRTITAGLADLTPDYPVLSEESESLPFEVRAGWQTYWLIDPLDGTREFIKRNGEFTVNIALIHDHVPVLGVVYAPAMEVGYHAVQGQGAVKEDAQGSHPIQARALGKRKPVIAGSRSHVSERLQAFLHRVGEHQLISMGSALKSCLVAEGKADLYARLGLTSEWDTAAAQCVVVEAGGQVTDTEMHPLRYNTKDSLLNPHFFVFGRDSRDWSQLL